MTEKQSEALGLEYDQLLVKYVRALRSEKMREAFVCYKQLKKTKCPDDIILWAERHLTPLETA